MRREGVSSAKETHNVLFLSQPPAREVPRGQDMDREPVFQLECRVPVLLVHDLAWVSPKSKMFPHAQPGDHVADLGPKRPDGVIIQMVPMVVGDKQVVDVRHLLGGIAIGPFEGSGAEKKTGEA